MTAIALEGVGFVYPDGTRALAGVDLAVAPGEVVAIVGQNGSGKSTLVRHLDGLLRPTEGRVLLDGQDIAGVRVALLAARVGMFLENIFQERFLRQGEGAPEVASACRCCASR